MTPEKKPLALITGASRGIGAEIARRLARDGFFVGINFASNETKARQLLEEIEKDGGAGELCGFDVADPTQVDSKIEDLQSRHGAIEVLVNNAGVTIDSLLLRLKNEDLERTLDVDLKGAIYCTRAVTKGMVRARKGSIIQVSSVIGEMGNAGQAAYAAAKSGLIGFSKSVAKELGSRGIRVNVITPGYIETEMTEALTDAQKEAILRSVPLGFFGSTQDVAALVSFLASSESRYLTGQVIGINGGMYM